jgi:hypothetical protein
MRGWGRARTQGNLRAEWVWRRGAQVHVGDYVRDCYGDERRVAQVLKVKRDYVLFDEAGDCLFLGPRAEVEVRLW